MGGKALANIFTAFVVAGLLPSVELTTAASGEGWEAAQLVEPDIAEEASHPQISVDGAGNAIVVWSQYDQVRQNISANRYAIGSGWGTAGLIEGNDSGDASNPQISVDTAGNAIAVWEQSDGSHSHIWSNRYAVGTGWGSVQLIETNDSGDASNPQVVMNGSGNAIAVWNQEIDIYDSYGNKKDGRTDIWSNRYVLGTGWSTAQLIETDDSGSAWMPQVAVDQSGNTIAVWTQVMWTESDPGDQQIWSNRYVVGKGWGTTAIISSTVSVYSSVNNPQVSIDGSGNAIVVWDQFDDDLSQNDFHQIWSNHYVLGTGWGTPELIDTDNSGEDSFGPQVAMDNSGNAIAVWYKDRDLTDMVYEDIWSNRYVAGVGWAAAELVETDNAGRAVAPQVSMHASGNATAVWCQYDGTRFNILANRYVPGTGWGTPEFLEDGYSGAYYPQVATDGSGNAMAVWHQGEGLHYDIWSNRYVILDGVPSESPGISSIVLIAIIAVVVGVALVIVFFVLRGRKGSV